MTQTFSCLASHQPAAVKLVVANISEIFQGCHPVHFLNSRAQGVREKAISITKPLSPDSPPVEGSSLFVQEAKVQDKPLIQLLKHDENVSNWVPAEIVICDSIKAQAGLLSKFLMMGKYCYESRNFATAIQILGVLENVIVRQLPNIAKVVSQIHAFQENKFTYVPDRELQTYLRQRIAYLSDCDIVLLAAENDTNFQQILAERHCKRIQDTLRKVKATFQ